MVLLPAPAAAATGEPCAAALYISTTDWQPPLDRVISFHAGETSLRDALDRVAAAAHVRLTYSAEALPLDRTVCLIAEGALMGTVLERLLGPTIELVTAGPDHVILAPRFPERPSMMVAPVVLDRIVVTGSHAGAAQRALPLALDVLDGRELERRRVATLAHAFGGSAPGVWLWEQSPGSLLLRFGSIRGASSFGLSYPKTFIDGIEVANPLLITRLVPESIERIELIRGPHGAALYGADAISGVMNVVTRIEQPGGRAAFAVQSRAGFTTGDYASDPALTTDHVATLDAGSSTRAVRLSLEAGSDGEYLQRAFSRHMTLAASGRSVAATSILSGTLRFFTHESGAPPSPILIDSLVPDSVPLDRVRVRRQSVSQYTAGLTMQLLPSERLRHALTAGVDGYALDGIFDDGTPIPSAADSALAAARGDATRGTLRWSSSVRLPMDRVPTDVALALDYSMLRQRTTLLARSGPSTSPTPGADAAELTRWRHTTGGGLVVNSALVPARVFANGGLRIERSTGLSDAVTLPMAGLAIIPFDGAVTLKLRGAYGKGIRWPETPIRETLQGRLRLNDAALSLDPEEQSGVEAGFDLIWARGFSLTVTRFDQDVSGLIQRVAIRNDSGPRARVRYQLQNVGAIANEGWEVQGTAARGRLAITAAFSLVESHVERLATGYAGDLRPGDRMLEVPRRTWSLSASWAGAPWFASVTAYRAEDWVNYDRLRLAADFAAADSTVSFEGAALRPYWRRYNGGTHLSVAISYPFHRRLTLTLSGHNLLDVQTGEPDNITVLPGRGFSAGLRGEF